MPCAWRRLLELDPTLWTHPSQVLDRPFSDAAELLEACRLRLEDVKDEGEKRRLEGVEEKLAVAVRIEEKARKRRGKRPIRPGASCRHSGEAKDGS